MKSVGYPYQIAILDHPIQHKGTQGELLSRQVNIMERDDCGATSAKHLANEVLSQRFASQLAGNENREGTQMS